MMIHLNEGQKKWAQRIGYPLLGLVTFVLALHYTFPYERLEDIGRDQLAEYYDVSDFSVSAGWIPGHIKVEGLTLTTRPEQESEKPISFTIDEADVNVGILAAIGGGYDIGITASFGGGEVTGSIEHSSDATRVDFETESLPLGTLPGIKMATGGVPLDGGLNAHLQVKLPKDKWKEADGSLEFSCDGCTIGDGVAKIRPMAPGQTNAFTNEGLTLPRLKLGKIGGKLAIKKGQGKFDEFQAKSPDGELYIEAEIRFEDPFKRSHVTGYLRFKASDELKKREDKMENMENMMAGAGRRPDGFIGVRIGPGQISQLRYVASKIDPLGREKEPPVKGGNGRTTGPAAGLRTPVVPPANADIDERPERPLPTPTPAVPTPAAPAIGEGAHGIQNVGVAPIAPGSGSGAAGSGSGSEGQEKFEPEQPPPQPPPEPPPEQPESPEPQPPSEE